MEPELGLYGAPSSQPSRAVYWAALLLGQPFELYEARVDQMGAGEGPISRRNPSAQVPVIDDGGFVVFEMPAILVYLCEKHGRDDFLPADLRGRTLVHQYLHFHHNFTRKATVDLMAVFVTVAFRDFIAQLGMPAFLERIDDPDKLAKGAASVAGVCDLIERGFFRGGSRFLCGDRATIADLACYEELAQLEWAKLYDFGGSPKIRAWFAEMRELPFHEPVHRYNTTLGDICTEPNTLERFTGASAAGVEALAECGVAARPIQA